MLGRIDTFEDLIEQEEVSKPYRYARKNKGL